MHEKLYSDDIIYCLEHIDEFSDEYLEEKLLTLKRNLIPLVGLSRQDKDAEHIDPIKTAEDIREKYGTSVPGAYHIPPEELTYGEIILLIFYPFLNRLCDSWEYEFAKSGRLLKYLLRLKEIEEKRN